MTTLNDIETFEITATPLQSEPGIVPVSDGENCPSPIEPLEHSLAVANTFEQVKDVRDRAEALRVLMRSAKAGLKAQNKAAAIKIRAERRMGEELARLEKAVGGRPAESGNTMLPVSDDGPATLAELGIKKIESSRWQAVSSVPEEVFSRYTAEVETRGEELTTAGLMRFAKRQQNGAQGAGNPEIPQSDASEEPAAKIGKAECGADVACGPDDPTPVTTAPAALQEPIGRPPGQEAAGPKRQHAPANEARAAEKRIEEELGRLAALPASERAILIEVAADRWGRRDLTSCSVRMTTGRGFTSTASISGI